MKMNLILALAGLAIGFAVSTLAQEKDAVDPQTRQQLEAIDKIFDEAYNKNDAAAIAALFTKDAVLISPLGMFSGRAGVEKYFVDAFHRWIITDYVSKISCRKSSSAESMTWFRSGALQRGSCAQSLCRQLLVDLVHPGEGAADTKKRVSMDDVAPTDAVRAVLKKLADARLVTTDRDDRPEAAQAELAHEAFRQVAAQSVSRGLGMAICAPALFRRHG